MIQKEKRNSSHPEGGTPLAGEAFSLASDDWSSFRELGADQLHRLVEHLAGASDRPDWQQARFLRELVNGHPNLELLAPAQLNIVCFRYTSPSLTEDAHDQFNAELVEALHVSGLAVLSTTRIQGRLAIRVNLTNHRTSLDDLQVLVNAIDETAATLVERFRIEFPSEFKGEPRSTARNGTATAVRDHIDSLCQRPEFQPLIKGVEIQHVPDLPAPFRVTSNGTLELCNEASISDEIGAVLLRHALEIAILQKIAGLTSPAAKVTRALFACETALKFWRFHFPPVGSTDLARSFWNQYLGSDSFSMATAEIDELKRVAKRLLPLQADESALAGQLTLQDWLNVRERLNACEIVSGPTEYLLTTGGDSRLEFDPHLGHSMYGCRRTPRQKLVSFASSTATSITHQNLEACEQIRQHLTAAALRGELELSAGAIADSLKRQVLEFCGAGDLPDTDVLLCSSGTDAELFATCLTAMAFERPLTNVLIAPAETGSGVPVAALGCHYNSQTPSGSSVRKGEPLFDRHEMPVEIVNIAARTADAQLLPVESLNRGIEQAVHTAVEKGHCLLHILAASKTGWQGPDRSLVERLTAQYGSRLSVIVDACQMRQDREVLREYLQAGYLVQVTGSKTFGGPPFSGALLIPKDHNAAFSKIKARRFPLRDYAARIEWPDHWNLTQQSLDLTVNIGLLLRWSAAAREMRCFHTVPDPLKATILQQLARTVRASLRETPEAVPSSAPPFELQNGYNACAWHQQQTIFPFRLKHFDAQDEKFLTHEEMKTLHRLLATDLSFVPGWSDCEATAAISTLEFQVGQPVELSKSVESPVSVLRICTGAHVVSRVTFDNALGKTLRARIEFEQHRIRLLFKKMRLILVNWRSIQHILAPEQDDLCLSK